MKYILVLILMLSGCTKHDIVVSGEVMLKLELSEEAYEWLDVWALSQYGQQSLQFMPGDIQKALYGYVIYPQGDL